jgi:DNA (cytosine-5)-methyltransferase 1
MPTFYEFFAGGGMARAGLGPDWTCLFSNDFDHKKSAVYRENWGNDVLKTADVRNIKTHELPGYPELIWASFPCQDLSLAGGGAGLRGERSGTFWPFWDLVKTLIEENRAPKLIVLENVCGTLTSHGGKDFAAICETFQKANYQYGAIVIDAAHFVPHSRPRLFIIGVRADVKISNCLYSNIPTTHWHSATLQRAFNTLTQETRNSWIWWNLVEPMKRDLNFSDIIEENPKCVSWFTNEETESLLSKMSSINLAKVEAVKKLSKRSVGAIYKRTRLDENGVKVQRAEVRFDNVAGCLRTPAGGSSRQLIMVIENNQVRARLISSRETARLMGLPDSYKLPKNYNEAYHLTGDGVVVPVVRFIASHILEPILTQNLSKAAA